MVILFVVRHNTIAQAERAIALHAEFVSDTTLSDYLRPEDFARPASGRRLKQLDAHIRSDVLTHDVVRANLFNPGGQVVYSTDRSLIGKALPDVDEVLEALEGETEREVSTLNEHGGSGQDRKVLEAYVPVRLAGSQPAGVLELYQDYAPVARAARGSFIPIASALFGALLLLYVSLFPILRRVTARLRRQMREIEHQALHDALTGLPNRTLLRDRLEQALAVAQRNGTPVAVMIIDLDRFKDVNDSLGHESGDRLLPEVGARLEARLRQSDTVARLGGDEFAVVLPQVSDAGSALSVAAKLRRALERPFTIDSLLVQIEASVGIALFPEHGDDANALIRHADVAMYRAKESHSGAEIYSPEHDHYSLARLALIADLRGALQRGEQLVLYYQPTARLESGEVSRVEALLRWRHPEHGLLGPDAFIPLAEHTGLIRQLTRYVINQALRQCRSWHDEGLELSVAVNLSGRDLLDVRLPDRVAALLAEHGVEGRHLELEITESTILTDPMRARAILTRLSELGVRLAIDDFGSGYSSLGYLKRLPVDVLKIDKSFVMNMDGDENDAVIVRSTIDLGHNLGLEVVAEGVESEEIWGELARLECDFAQGFYLSRPMPADAVRGWLETMQTRHGGGRLNRWRAAHVAEAAPRVREAAPG